MPHPVGRREGMKRKWNDEEEEESISACWDAPGRADYVLLTMTMTPPLEAVCLCIRVAGNCKWGERASCRLTTVSMYLGCLAPLERSCIIPHHPLSLASLSNCFYIWNCFKSLTFLLWNHLEMFYGAWQNQTNIQKKGPGIMWGAGAKIQNAGSCG